MKWRDRVVELVAHRGASHDAPENTLAAIDLAWNQGADTVEIDVHVSRDGEIVVIHDESTFRTAAVDRPVCEQTLSELRRLDAGAWKGACWAGERIPVLSEVLATLKDAHRLFIEIKCGPEIIPALDRSFREWGGPLDRITIIGFCLADMRAIKQRWPHLQVHGLGCLEYDSGQNAWSPPLEDCIASVRQVGLDGAGLSECAAIDHSFVRKFHAANLKLGVWTVDTPSTATRLLDAGVDCLTTNRPGWLRQELSKQEPHVCA